MNRLTPFALALTLPLVLAACENDHAPAPGPTSPGPALMEEPPAETPSGTGVSSQERIPLTTAAVTIEGFYAKIDRFDCPAGGDPCDVPNGKLRVDCDDGDFATGGTAFSHKLNNRDQMSLAADQPIGNTGWRTAQGKLSADTRLAVKIICVDL